MTIISDKAIRDAIVAIYDETPTVMDEATINEAYARLTSKKTYTFTTPQSFKKWTHNPLTGRS